MSKQISIYVGLILLILCSSPLALPLSIITLNDIAENLEKHIRVNNIHVDKDDNIIGFFGRYDAERIMSIYGFRIDSKGNIVEKPGILFAETGPFTVLNVIGDKFSNIHMLINVFSECDLDYYLLLDKTGKRTQSIWHDGKLSCCNILSDSIFISFRIAPETECVMLDADTPNDLFYKFEYKTTRNTSFTLINIPFIDLNCYTPILETTPENRILIILNNYEKTGYYDYIYPTKFASFMADFDQNEITRINQGNIKDKASYVYKPLNQNIGVNGTSTIWLGDSLLFYSRVPGDAEDYYHKSESLYVVVFYKNGELMESDENYHGEIEYKNIDDFGPTEKLIDYWVIKTGKYKFGLISFKDFPKIYIDLGEK